jgi:nucleotide sugar dehydrogenase
MNIGIMGMGFVGQAIYSGFAHRAQVMSWDKYRPDDYDDLFRMINRSDFIHVCVPTVWAQDHMDTSEVWDAVRRIDHHATSSKNIIIKSTMPIGETRQLACEFATHYFAVIPEWLTNRTARSDFITPSRIIIGGEDWDTKSVEKIYKERFPHVPFFITTWEGAELLKLACNSYFAMKVTWCNFLAEAAEEVDIPYKDLRDMWLADGRIAADHTDVPGHDGRLGYGGKCYPKDIQALYAWAEDAELRNGLLGETIRENWNVRRDEP